MATLTLRNVKGSALTHDELDSNFGALDSDITAINTTIAGGVGLGADSVNSLIDTRIDSDTFVTLTGDQTIGGIKTFSDSAVFSGPLFGDGSNLTGIESYDSAKVQGQIDSDFPTREIGGLSNVNAPTPLHGESLIYDSASSKWVAGSTAIRQEFHFTPSAGTASLTGDDKFGNLLQYNADSDELDVFVNGVLLVDSDFTRTNNGTITLDVATSASDEVVIRKYRSIVTVGTNVTDLVLNDFTDVAVASPTNNQSLFWDSSQQSWVAGNLIDSAQHTSAEIRQMFSASGDLSYNSTTGDISYTAPAASGHDSVATQGQIDSAAVALTGNQTVAGAKTFSDTIDFDNFMSLTAAGGTQYISFDGGVDLQDDNGILGSYLQISGTTGKITIPRSAVAGTQSASVSGATTLNFDTYQNFVLTLTGATTLSNPTTETVGQTGFITFIQDGTGSRAVSLSSDFETPAVAGLTLSTGAGETDMVPYIVISSGRILLGTPQLAFG